ncbi:MAG TPA: hypothetical protein DDW52_15115 [Planctomycetaceae bacterium]|nr:hypothetical protein [Planctomycetaceae bacterium]
MQPRVRLFVDSPVQGALVRRVVLYWAVAVCFVAMHSVGSFELIDRSSVGRYADLLVTSRWVWVPTSALLLPLAIYDMLRLSNRFAGPILRLKAFVVESEQVKLQTPLQFRQGDFWQDLPKPVNHLQQRILLLEQHVETLKEDLELARKSGGADSAASTLEQAEAVDEDSSAELVGKS